MCLKALTLETRKQGEIIMVDEAPKSKVKVKSQNLFIVGNHNRLTLAMNSY